MRASKLNWVNSQERKPTACDADIFGYILARIRHHQSWTFRDFRIDDPALVQHNWQWLEGATDFEDSENKHDATK